MNSYIKRSISLQSLQLSENQHDVQILIEKPDTAASLRFDQSVVGWREGVGWHSTASSVKPQRTPLHDHIVSLRHFSKCFSFTLIRLCVCFWFCSIDTYLARKRMKRECSFCCTFVRFDVSPPVPHFRFSGWKITKGLFRSGDWEFWFHSFSVALPFDGEDYKLYPLLMGNEDVSPNELSNWDRF